MTLGAVSLEWLVNACLCWGRRLAEGHRSLGRQQGEKGASRRRLRLATSGDCRGTPGLRVGSGVQGARASQVRLRRGAGSLLSPSSASPAVPESCNSSGCPSRRGSPTLAESLEGGWAQSLDHLSFGILSPHLARQLRKLREAPARGSKRVV